MSIHLGGKNYSIGTFKEKLDKAGPNFEVFLGKNQGARKIDLGGEIGEHKYNEILEAVQAAIEEQKDTGHVFTNNDDIHAICGRLQVLKDEGHKDTGFLYNLFRRYLPNFFREDKLNAIEKELKTQFPSTEQLKESIQTQKQLLTVANTYKSHMMELYNQQKLTIQDAATLADYLVNKQPPVSKEEWYQFWSRLLPDIAENVIKVISEEKWPIALSVLLPEGVTAQTIGSNFTKDSDFEVLYALYEGMTDTQRAQHFPGLLMKVRPDRDVEVSSDRVKWHNRTHEVANYRLRQKNVQSSRYDLTISLAHAKTSNDVAKIISEKTSYIQNTVLGLGLNYKAALEEQKFLVGLVKESVPEKLYNEYITSYLQNPEKVQLGQAVILVDYLMKTPKSEVWDLFWWRDVQTNCIGLVLAQIPEEDWTHVLKLLQLREIKELVGQEKSQQDVQNRFKEQSLIPYLHKLHSIYSMMTEEQRTRYFVPLLLEKGSGSVKISRDGQNWVEIR